jgi:hypothetical protein
MFWCSCMQCWLTISPDRATLIRDTMDLDWVIDRLKIRTLRPLLELDSLSFDLRRSSLSFICAIEVSPTINMTVKRACTLITGLQVSNRSTPDIISQAPSFKERDMRSLCVLERKDCSVLLANLWAGPMEAEISTCGISKLYRVAHF